MPTFARISLWLTFALSMSACGHGGGVRCPEPPKLAPVPASLMQKPTTEQKVRGELFVPPPSVTPR